MLILDDRHILGRGGLRICYRHPHDPDFVIKLPAQDNKAARRANLNEFAGFQALIAKHGRLSFISRCHGFVATNRGEGLVCDCIRDANGVVSKTLWDLFASHEGYDIDRIISIATDLCDILQKREVWLFDLNFQNLVLQVQQDDSYRLVIIDLKGRFNNNEFIKISSYFDFFARKKVKRRCRRLLERLYAQKKEGENRACLSGLL